MTALEAIRKVKSERRVTISKVGYGELQGQATALLRDIKTYSLYLDSEIVGITYNDTIFIEVE